MIWLSVPKLRFPEFSGEWEEKKLENVAKVNDGTHFTPEYQETGVPFFSVETVASDAKPKFISRNEHKKLIKRCNPKKGDILLTRIGTLAESKLVEWNYEFSIYVSLALIKTNRSIDSSYLNQFFKSEFYKKDFLRKSLLLATPKKINVIDLKKTNVIIPSHSEQEKIASFLSKVDEKIEKLEKKQELWETYKKGIMQQIFSQQLRFKDENGEDYPDWEEKTLNEISSINPKSEKLPAEFVYIDLESVESGVLKKQALITKDEAPSRAQRILKNNDILYQMVRPYQRNNFFFNNTNSEIYVASTGYAQIRSKQDPEFIYHSLHTDDFVNKVLARCTGTSYPAINSNDLGKIKLNVPSILEQEKVSKFISAIESKINQLNTELDINKEFKKGLLQQMFC